MRMLIFSKNAAERLEDLLEYLESRFSVLTKEKFITKFDSIIYLIQKDPGIFPKSEINKNCIKCVVSKQTTIFYRFNNKEVRILSLFDTRQNPNKIKQIK